MTTRAGSGRGRDAETAEPARRAATTSDEGPLGLVGHTPLVRLARLSPEGGAAVWAKAEFLNPGGSVKDRPALSMVIAAEREDRLTEGATLVEATSGNTGISLAMIAALRGYKCVLVMPEDMSVERRYILRAYGAEIVLTPATDGMIGAVEKAHDIVKSTPSAFMPSQFENAANPDSHEHGTAAEILEQTGGVLDAFIAGVGTGGTITGVGRRLRRELGRQVRIIAVEPAQSAVLSGRPPGMHGIQGLGAGFVPKILDRSVIDEVVTVTDVAAERMARRLAREEGLLVGPSSGANVHAAVEVAKRHPAGKVVTILCDSGERYLF
ncbi:MAG TPA: cysteine synthase A [Polyangiaceae bacterium]|jgi:cysteine synthase A|nr:cysteine synthase A [Polyangiaceae bacterium]